MKTIHVTYPGEWVCMCARGGARRWARSLAQHTHIYTYIHLHTGWLCALGRGGGGHWCYITWEWVGNVALIHVWMHRVIYMNVSVSSWTSASKNHHYPTRKIIWCHCHQQEKERLIGLCMNESVGFQADASRNCHDPTKIAVTSHCCPPKKRKRYMGTYMNMSMKSWADVSRNYNFLINKRWCYCHCQTPNIYTYIYGHICQCAHKLPSRCLKEPPGAPGTTMAILIGGEKTWIQGSFSVFAKE